MTSSRKPSIFLIVTPSFNQAQFIKQTIDSVLSQHTDDIQVEYIVVDGKSSDTTVSILKKYNDNLDWVSEKDQGQTDAINKGVKYLESRIKDQKLKVKSQMSNVIFAYINSDDYYLSSAFEHVVAEFNENPDKQWLVGDAIIVDQNNKEIQSYVRWYKKILRSIFPSWILFILNPYPQPATFIRWSAVQKIGEFNTDLRYTMDYEYWLRLRSKFGEPIVANQALAAFRIHTQSKGGSQFEKQFSEELSTAKRFTQNPLLTLLHTLHNFMIQLVYQRIK